MELTLNAIKYYISYQPLKCLSLSYYAFILIRHEFSMEFWTTQYVDQKNNFKAALFISRLSRASKAGPPEPSLSRTTLSSSWA